MKILDILVEDEYIDPKERKRQQQERDKAAMDGKVLFVQLKPDQRQGVLGEITTVLDKPINQYLSSVFNKNARLAAGLDPDFIDYIEKYRDKNEQLNRTNW